MSNDILDAIENFYRLDLDEYIPDKFNLYIDFYEELTEFTNEPYEDF